MWITFGHRWLSSTPPVLVNHLTWNISPKWLWHQKERRHVVPVYSNYEHFIRDQGKDRLSIAKMIDAFASIDPDKRPQCLTFDMVREIIRDYSFVAQKGYLEYRGRTERKRKRDALAKGFVDPPKLERCKYPYWTLFDPKTRKMVYGDKWNTIISFATIQNSDPFWRLRSASLFGQKLVIDFSYDHLMREKEHSSLARQVSYISYKNRVTPDPFDIVLTNFHFHQKFMNSFHANTFANIPEDLMMSVYSQPVNEVLDPENCIYLSPHAEDVMETFDHNKAYIIGGLVDTYRNDCSETSFDHANKMGISSQRLPIQVPARNYRCPRLSLDVVAQILFNCKHSNMTVSQSILKCLPPRALRPPRAKQRKDIVVKTDYFELTDEADDDCQMISQVNT